MVVGRGSWVVGRGSWVVGGGGLVVHAHTHNKHCHHTTTVNTHLDRLLEPLRGEPSLGGGVPASSCEEFPAFFMELTTPLAGDLCVRLCVVVGCALCFVLSVCFVLCVCAL